MARAKKATEAPIDRLDAMLARLQLPGIRDQLDSLLDEAARAKRPSGVSAGIAHIFVTRASIVAMWSL